MLRSVLLASLAVATQGTTSAADQQSAISTQYPSEIAVVMDPSVSPCDDFFLYSCGSWIKTAQVPEDSNYLSYSFSKVDDDNRETLVGIYEQGKPIVSDLYQSCVNVDNHTESGAQLVEGTQIKISSVKSKRELFRLAGEISMNGPSFLSSVTVSPDPKHATRNILIASVAGLTLQDPNIYTDPDAWSRYEEPYRRYLTQLFTLFGMMNTTAQVHTNTVIQLETQIAEIFVNISKQQQNETTSLAAAYHPIAFQDAAHQFPNMLGSFTQGLDLLNRLLLQPTDAILLSQPTTLQAIEQFTTTASLDSLQTLLLFQFLDDASSLLGEPFLTLRFEFYDRFINDQQKPTPRAKYCANIVQGAFHDLVGKYFFDARFSNEQEQQAQSMVDMIEKTMQTRLENSQWLDTATRKAALEKLSLVRNLIGHSPSVEHFPEPLNATAFLANMRAIAGWASNRSLAKLGKPVDRNEWGMSGAEVNAYYDPSANKMVFPAGILQPPFFNSSSLAVQNFGAIGVVMGHELTHGFDDTGRQYDGYGNLAPWWTNKTNTRFEERTKCLADQYSSFQVTSATNSSKVIGFLDGNATLGENIADNGGFGLALDAFHAFSQATKTRPSGMTQEDMDRVFYVAYAQLWCSKATDGKKKQTLSDSHSPDEFRVNGVMQNNVHFGKLFQCNPGTRMNPRSKCQVW